MNKYTTVNGTCMRMCPESEIEMREREGLLHPLECITGGGRQKKRKADRGRAVKAFSRSAAGRDLLRPDMLRPAPVLRDTVYHLISMFLKLDCRCSAAGDDCLVGRGVSWPVVYQFVADRLRAVRQDMVVQRLPPEDTASLLEPMVRFHAYAAYRLCEEEQPSTFDPHLNKSWLNETLKYVLACNDANARTHARHQMEALYGVLHLGHVDALHRLVSLDPPRGSVLHAVLRMSLAHLRNNFVVVCRTLRCLPPLLACVVTALHLPLIRRRALGALSTAYSCRQQLTYPAELLVEQLLYDSADDVADDCRRCGLTADPATGIVFNRAAYDPNAKQSPAKRLAFVDASLTDILGLLTSSTEGECKELPCRSKKKKDVVD